MDGNYTRINRIQDFLEPIRIQIRLQFKEKQKNVANFLWRKWTLCKSVNEHYVKVFGKNHWQPEILINSDI